MTETKKNENQHHTRTTSAVSDNHAEKQQNKHPKTCPALYPSKPHTSNK